MVCLLALFLSGIGAAALILHSVQQEELEARRMAQFYGRHFSQKIALLFQTLSQNLHPIYTMLVLQKGNTHNFEHIADYITASNPEIININIARNGVVTHVFPHEENKKALGHDLLRAEDRRQEANLAKQTKKLTLSGPFKLLQGGTGLAFRQPIYLPSPPEEREKIFWGFAIITYRFPEVISERIEFDMLSAAGFSWELWRTDPVSGKRAVLLSADTPLDKSAQRHEIPLQNVSWHLDICPENGWVNKKKLFLYISIGFSLCVLFSVAATQFATLINKNQEITIQAQTDSLTGLYNKTSFLELLEPALKRHLKNDCQNEEERLFLCVFDLNNFKQINDTYGHITGDKVLAEFAGRLSREISPRDFASRFGGDEFVAVFYCVPREEWLLPEKLEQIKLRLEGNYDINGKQLEISVSLGAISPKSDMLREKKEHLTLGEFFLEKVDMAMYSEKQTFHMLENLCTSENSKEKQI